MKSKLLKSSILWQILAVILFSGTIFSQELRKEGRYFVAEITETFKVDKGGTLRVYDVRGDVRIETWAKNEVKVNEVKRMDVFTEKEARTVFERSKSSYQQSGNVVEIGGEYYSRDWIKSNFVVTVPKEFNVDVETRGGDLRVGGLMGDVDLHTSGGEIILDDIDGNVEAKTSGGNIEVNNSKQRVDLKTSGGDLDLRNIGGVLMAKTSGGDITLKGSSNRVELHTSGGDIDIIDVGGEVRAHTSGGDIDVRNTKGATEVHTSGGDIRLGNIGGSLEASTSGGDVEGRTIQGGAEVSTSGGNIELTAVNGGVRAKTSGGDISVEIMLTDFSKDHRVDMRSSGGELELFIPEKLPATIQAEIEITDRWGDYNIYSDFPLTSTEEPGEERGRRYRSRRFIRNEGDINGGGDVIELFTTNGDIHIKKLRK
ncbi:DUF4097 domain-containing protein [candidate division KSB1 bacterium]|nr:DUF4097 domain-containing protein [candidate division KSB1 bacterium]NIR72639.1 DUF4097 domain-containing protein [candidate division KSB1 bacterium]NIS27350.1 DUF4097 domain-containing protein [candidate division KSB1 bacterium]NIT73563.1 DUF4097 domain-containing protein [candidate division KSB1 bacterium]NIU25411.1 DUF4097 domain-containing protein [candidate division KSB1 bacterium]